MGWEKVTGDDTLISGLIEIVGYLGHLRGRVQYCILIGILSCSFTVQYQYFLGGCEKRNGLGWGSRSRQRSSIYLALVFSLNEIVP